MKDRIVIDFGQVMDEIFEATQNFGNAFKNGFAFHNHGKDSSFRWGEDVDYYPHHSYPPANVYLNQDKTLVFEFAMAGFEESSIDLQFQGDYMVLSAKAPVEEKPSEEVRFFKKRLKLKDVEDQKYYVPEDKFDRESVKAVFKNGLLRVTITGKVTVETKEGIKIEIVEEESK